MCTKYSNELGKQVHCPFDCEKLRNDLKSENIKLASSFIELYHYRSELEVRLFGLELKL